MTDEDKLKQWEETQTEWDDREFLEKSANSFMKKRWKRLTKLVADIITAEVLGKTEYIDLLDIGAGRGEFYKAVEGSVKRYTGIEPSIKMLTDEIRDEDMVLKHGKGEEIDEAEAYDACLIKEALDHCYNPQEVSDGAFRALRDNGIFIVTLTNKNSYYKLLFKKHADKLRQEHRDHLYEFCPADVRKIMEKSGFKVEKILSINYLRLPSAMEELLGKLPEKMVFFILGLTDALSRPFLPEKGGGFIVVGRKNPAPAAEQAQ